MPDKFIAYTNLGLVEAAASNFSAAAVNHRLALRCAIMIFLRSVEGEALVCGNLVAISRCEQSLPPRRAPRVTPPASAGGDSETARHCMQRYLKLSVTLHDSRVQEGLGKLAAAGACVDRVLRGAPVTRAMLQRGCTARRGSASMVRAGCHRPRGTAGGCQRTQRGGVEDGGEGCR